MTLGDLGLKISLGLLRVCRYLVDYFGSVNMPCIA